MGSDLFDDFDLYDGLCTLAILIGSMIAAGGGLGGGGVFVPIYILIISMTTKKAAALSQATILGGSFINLWNNWPQRHPERKHRPIIDFPILLVFEPMLLVGSTLGVMLNTIFPDMLILILLVVTLVYATVRTGRKGVRMWQQESKALEERANLEQGFLGDDPLGPSINKEDAGFDTEDPSTTTTTGNKLESSLSKEAPSNEDTQLEISQSQSASYGSMEESTDAQKPTPAGPADAIYDTKVWGEMAEMCGVDVSQLDRAKMDILEPLLEKEKERWKPMGVIAIVWIISLSTSVAKKEVTECGAAYWVCEFISWPFLAAISVYFCNEQYKIYDAKESSGGWVPAEGDIKWNQSIYSMVKYPIIATVAGLLGGLLGIGGGMIVSPLLMELGVEPRVAAATSAMCVMITASSATLQYALLGYFTWEYLVYFMVIGVIGTFIGVTVVGHCITKYNRKSLIIFSVAIIMGLAVILMGIDGILEVMDGISWAFVSPCS